MIRIRYPSRISYAWVVVALCVVTTIPAAFTYAGMGVLFPFIQKELDISRAQIGLISSGMFVGGAATVLFAGWLIDVVGVRRLQTAILIGMAVALALFSQVHSLLQAILAAVLIGVSPSATLPAHAKAIMDWATRGTRGVAMGLRESSLQVGGIIAALLFTYLAVNFGWRSAVVFLAVVALASGILFFGVYRDKPSEDPGPETSGTRGDGGKQAVKDRDYSLVAFLSAAFMVAKDRNLLLVSLFGGFFSGVYTVLLTYLVLYFREELEMSAGVAGGLLALAMAGGGVSRVGWGLVSDLLLHGRRIGPLALVGVLSVICFALMALLPSDAPLGLVSVLVLAVGITAMGWSGLITVLIAELAGPAAMGTAMGFAALIMQLGSFGVAPVFGLVVDRTDSYNIAWWMTAGIAGGGTLLLAFLKPVAHTSGRQIPKVQTLGDK